MSYGDETVKWFFNETATADVIETTGDAGSDQIFTVLSPITVFRVGALVTELVATDATAGIIKFDRRVTYASDTGRGDGDIGTITIPDTTAVGKIIYSEAIQIDLDAGDQIVPQVTTAGVDAGTEAGEMLYIVWYYDRHETPANQTDLVASA